MPKTKNKKKSTKQAQIFVTILKIFFNFCIIVQKIITLEIYRYIVICKAIN